MTIGELEQALKSCNPQLHIKRTASGKAGVHLGNRFICRVDQGDISLYNHFRWEEGLSDQLRTPLNPKGWHKYRRLLKRGRCELARVLYTQRVITLADVPKITWRII